MNRAVIFDMDGVIVDTEPVHLQASVDFFRYHGQNTSIEKLQEVIGTSIGVTNEMFGSMWTPPMSGIEFAQFRKANKRSYTMNYSDLKFPHIQYVMEKLKQHNFKLGVASSSRKKEIEDVLEACDLSHYIDHYKSGHEFKESKPNPEIYIKTMELLGVHPNNTIIIEDSYYGIKAAKAAGAFVIAIRDHRFNINQEEADIIVGDILEAYNVVQERWS